MFCFTGILTRTFFNKLCVSSIFECKRIKKNLATKALITEKNAMPLVGFHDLDAEKRT